MSSSCVKWKPGGYSPTFCKQLWWTELKTSTSQPPAWSFPRLFAGCSHAKLLPDPSSPPVDHAFSPCCPLINYGAEIWLIKGLQEMVLPQGNIISFENLGEDSRSQRQNISTMSPFPSANVFFGILLYRPTALHDKCVPLEKPPGNTFEGELSSCKQQQEGGLLRWEGKAALSKPNKWMIGLLIKMKPWEEAFE